jgi:transmembrane sensor
MSNRLEELRAARDHVEPEWGEPEIERVLGRVHVRLRTEDRRRRVVTGLALAAGVCAAVGGGFAYGRRTAVTPTAPVASLVAPATPNATTGPSAPTAAPPEGVFRYPDGSAAYSTAPGTRLQLDEASPDRVTTALETGAARFDVVPDHDREFRVRVEGVTVTVLGTIFAVTRGESSVHVAVERGKVRVESASATALLVAGEEGDYPLAAAPGTPGPASSATGANGTGRGASASPPSESWRALARRGRHQDAYALMHDLRPKQVKDAEELLAAADVARLSGHPREAVPFLERVLTDFHGDPRAPVAAFGLGRVLLPTQPAAAAARFAEARALAPSGAIAEDALAREVEAWSRAGAANKARDAAAEYVRRYPRGSRVDEVRKMAGSGP